MNRAVSFCTAAFLLLVVASAMAGDCNLAGMLPTETVNYWQDPKPPAPPSSAISSMAHKRWTEIVHTNPQIVGGVRADTLPGGVQSRQLAERTRALAQSSSCDWALTSLSAGTPVLVEAGTCDALSGADGVDLCVGLAAVECGNTLMAIGRTGRFVAVNRPPRDGSTGPKGYRGDAGPQGPKGDMGDTGEVGFPGPRGPGISRWVWAPVAAGVAMAVVALAKSGGDDESSAPEILVVSGGCQSDECLVGGNSHCNLGHVGVRGWDFSVQPISGGAVAEVRHRW